MQPSGMRMAALAGAVLAAGLLAACTSTRQPPASAGDAAGNQTATVCVGGQSAIPGGPPRSPTIGGSTQTETMQSGGVSITTTMTEGDPRPVFGASMFSASGTWTATDTSPYCGCSIELTETFPGQNGTALTRGCQSFWLRQAVYFEFRNEGRSVAFFGSDRRVVLFEVQRNGPNLMDGTTFGQRITLFRG